MKAMHVSPPPRDIQSSPREEGRDQNSWRGQPDDHAGQPQPSKLNHEAKFDALQQRMSLPKWCACLTSAVLRTRTPFAAFLARTFHLPRTSQSASPSMFPVPLPSGEPWARMPPDLSSRKRRQIHVARAIHIIVLALNFYHAGGPCSLEALGRTPNAYHKGIYQRIRSLIRAEGQATIQCIASSGRRLPQLVARLSELSQALTSIGPSCNPYDKVFNGFEVAPTTDAEELKPYRNLDAKRLVLTGRGAWDATEFLQDELVLAFREPASLLFTDEPLQEDVPLITDDPSEIVALASVWDKQGLLFIHDGRAFDEHPECYTRIFNAFKNVKMDRQIGDRRSRNSCEGRVKGPSAFLPCGPDLLDWYCNPRTHYIAQAITDRKDFYHQFAVSDSRAFSNTVGPPVDASELEQFDAFSAYLLRQAKSRYHRGLHGDRLGLKGQRLAKGQPQKLFVAFRSILQGDHTGVDVATSAHLSLLKGVGLLDEKSRLQSCTPLFDQSNCEGLCIDDYFAMSLETLGTPLQASGAKLKIDRALEAYQQAGILGSPEKDALADKAKIVGAVCNSSAEARAQGVVTLGAPIEKRIALSVISLQLCTLTHTTDVLHVCLTGGWASAFMFRRPLMGLLHRVYDLVQGSVVDPNRPKICRLPRSVANEFVLAAILMPLASSDLSADFNTLLYCSDASSRMGAFCSASIPRDLSSVIWKACKSKGAYTRLLSQVESDIKRIGGSESFEDELETAAQPVNVRRPLAYRFAFIELFAGSSKVTEQMSQLGWSVGPPIDLSFSPEYDLSAVHVMSWLSHLIVTKSIESFACEPPCTTFSIMRRPQLRSKLEPYGFCPADPQTKTGTVLALRGLQCLHLGHRVGTPGWLETPFSSRLKALPPYKRLQGAKGADFCRSDSCCFGSEHLKPFAFLSVWAPLSRVRRRCRCSGKHLQVQGQYTKSSAMYTDDLAQNLALVLHDAILAKRALDEDWDGAPSAGLESLLVNQLALEAPWQTEKKWTFKGASHINIQESVSVLRAIEHASRKGSPQRTSILVDSNVVRCAVSKGRTSSRGLMPILAKINAVSLAAGQYLCLPFCPTRLNPSDDPTRGVELRSPVREGATLRLSLSEWEDVASHKGLKSTAANWLRFVVLVGGTHLLSLRDQSSFRQPPVWEYRSFLNRAFPREFDSTLGFPGEGPLLLLLWIFVASPLSSSFLGGRGTPPFWISGAILGGTRCAMAVTIEPRNPGDQRRADYRKRIGPLPTGRPVLKVTEKRREVLLSAFTRWLEGRGVVVDDLFVNTYQTIEEINTLLTAYGRELHLAGRPLNDFSETINSISSWKPQLRRTLQGAWDLAYSWVKTEPAVHHTAMPAQVLMACLSCCFAWGWVRMAGCLAMAWGGLLRAGELFQARRQDLQLPSDLAGSVPFALLAINEPKTRHSTARHQCSKLDIPDLVSTIELAFRSLRPSELLWDRSPQTMRNRLRSIFRALRLPVETYKGVRALDLGSLRPGGATHLLQTTESGDLVMRRGRWASYRVMSIYIQEVAATSFLSILEKSVREQVLELAFCFTTFLEQAWAFEQAKIPREVWYLLFTATQQKAA